MEKVWKYNDRGNSRRRALRLVSELFDSEQHSEGQVEDNLELTVCVDDSGESDMEISDEESDHQNFEEDVEDKEVHGETAASVEDQSDLGEPCSQRDSDLQSSLADWAIEFGISLIALSAPLTILKVHHSSLPKDGRTLLKTKTSYSITSIAGGVFHYCGILNSVRKILDKVWHTVGDKHVFKLQLNFDGLPLFKSTATQFWPILGLLQGHTKAPVLIGLFCGTSKPNSLADYLHDLVQELKMLRDGFLFKQKTFFLHVASVVCDTPARAFIRGVKSHTGYRGCDKCHQTCVWKSNRMTFPEVNAKRRTDESFRQETDEKHHIQHSPLADIGIDMVTCFPHDYMHLVCLGVMRRLLDLWMSTIGPLHCRISSIQASMVSNRLLALRSYIPNEFARRPRALADRCRWKATELRQFLLYTGPVVLNDVLQPQIYDNFMLFEDVKIHGNLDLISGFPFENFLGNLKKLVRGPCNPLTPFDRRFASHNKLVNLKFLRLAVDGIVVKLNERDSCVKIDNKLVLVQNIVEDKGAVYLVGNEYKQKYVRLCHAGVKDETREGSKTEWKDVY
ncbi:hypothetical protein M9458_053103 [Cirrhinus mrigala]|uniref:Transposase domain-containing protein n=1 Tax=Cirrhinus mrigala TaxID=683832 RepID=A0ABD0MRK6_CIRMR